MEITKLYLYESAVVIVRHNQVFLEHNCFFSSKGSELRKCLLKKIFKKGEDIFLLTELKRII